MRMLSYLLLAALLGWLVWTGWHPPASVSRNAIHFPLPNDTEKAVLWRVVTRRVISMPSLQGMIGQFSRAELYPAIFSRNEEVELHAFEDMRSFTTGKEAARARDEWIRLKLNADIIRRDGSFRIALGRFFMAAHASHVHAQLKKTGRPFRYEKRHVAIPVRRFTFRPLPLARAQQLWKKVKELGFADPVLMPERQFADIYGKTGSGHQSK